MNSLRVALVQMCSGTDIPENLATIEMLLNQPETKGLDLVVLPECFARLGGSVAETSLNASAIREWMSNLANHHDCWLVGGSTPVPVGNGKSFASCFVYSPLGKEVSCYNKIHLFDADVEDATGQYRESADYQSGDDIKAVNTGQATLGLSICYDLRFPELYRKLFMAGANIICVPSAFTKVTGTSHWQPLLQARAIENQSFVLAANQTGIHSKGRETYGHSLVISPWGEILAIAGTEPELVIAELDLNQPGKVRRQVPCQQHIKLV